MIEPTNIPALLIAVPIIVAALPLVAGIVRDKVGWWIALGGLLVEAVLAAVLTLAVVGDGRVVHPIGGDLARMNQVGEWAIGIELVADPLSTFVVALVAVVSLAVLATTRQNGPRGNAFYSGYLLLTGGLMGVALTGDLFNMFVFLEITGLATYALVASSKTAESAVAALKYLIIGTMGASLFLVGVGYLYVATGILNMAELSAALAGDMPGHIEEPIYDTRIVVASFGFIAVGLATKAAIFPMHTWQPDAYAAAPDSVTTYISALASTVAAYALARVSLTVYTPEFFAQNEHAAQALLAFACVSIVAGTVLAVMQRDVKRLLAYSSVSQFGLILAAIGVAVYPGAPEATLPVLESEITATQFALFAVIIHLVGHGLMKGTAFALAGGVRSARGSRLVSEYAGLAKTHPLLAGCLAVVLLALVGVPPSIGFIGKWYVGLAAVAAEVWPVVIVLFFSTLLTMLYAARLLETMYFTPVPDSHRRAVVADGGKPDGSDDGPADGNAGPAANGNAGTPSTTDDSGPATPGAILAGDTGPRGVAFGTVAVVVTATLLIVALGFAGELIASEAIEPYVDEVIPR